MQVPTGGIARERESVDPVNLNLNDSGADSIVWMKEECIWKTLSQNV